MIVVIVVFYYAVVMRCIFFVSCFLVSCVLSALQTFWRRTTSTRATSAVVTVWSFEAVGQLLVVQEYDISGQKVTHDWT